MTVMRRLRLETAVAAAGLFLAACVSPIDTSTRSSEMESVWQYLKAYSIYQDSSIYAGRIPDDPFTFKTPEALMKSLGDTLHGDNYTTYFEFSGASPFGGGDGNISQRAAADAHTQVFLDTLSDSTVRITIEVFTTGVTYTELREVLDGVNKFPFVIVDLAGNGGGNIDEVKLVVNAFLPSGTSYLRIRDREYDRETRTARTNNWHLLETDDLADSRLANKKITVVMNNGSASASEILIAALKDCRDATLVGSRSYGKGIGQITLPRRDRLDLKITFMQMRGKSARIGEYHRLGIKPDVQADGTEEQVLLAAVKVHEPAVTGLRKIRRKSTTPTPVAGYHIVYE